MDEIDSDRRIVAIVQRLYEGDEIIPAWVGTEKQVLTRLYFVCDTKEDLAVCLKEYQGKIKVYDTDGNNMVLHGFDVDEALELK
jgi:hypothetical protein